MGIRIPNSSENEDECTPLTDVCDVSKRSFGSCAKEEEGFKKVKRASKRKSGNNYSWNFVMAWLRNGRTKGGKKKTKQLRTFFKIFIIVLFIVIFGCGLICLGVWFYNRFFAASRTHSRSSVGGGRHQTCTSIRRERDAEDATSNHIIERNHNYLRAPDFLLAEEDDNNADVVVQVLNAKNSVSKKTTQSNSAVTRKHSRNIRQSLFEAGTGITILSHSLKDDDSLMPTLPRMLDVLLNSIHSMTLSTSYTPLMRIHLSTDNRNDGVVDTFEALMECYAMNFTLSSAVTASGPSESRSDYHSSSRTAFSAASFFPPKTKGSGDAEMNDATVFDCSIEAAGTSAFFAEGGDVLQSIERHYRCALEKTFKLYKYGIFLEDDLRLSPDFLSYMLSTQWLLADSDSVVSDRSDSDLGSTSDDSAGVRDRRRREETKVWCVSGWNDNGYKKNVLDNEGVGDYKLLLRTDFFPGLGWMTAREIWQTEIEPRWDMRLMRGTSIVISGWDYWFRVTSDPFSVPFPKNQNSKILSSSPPFSPLRSFMKSVFDFGKKDEWLRSKDKINTPASLGDCVFPEIPRTHHVGHHAAGGSDATASPDSQLTLDTMAEVPPEHAVDFSKSIGRGSEVWLRTRTNGGREQTVVKDDSEVRSAYDDYDYRYLVTPESYIELFEKRLLERGSIDLATSVGGAGPKNGGGMLGSDGGTDNKDNSGTRFFKNYEDFVKFRENNDENLNIISTKRGERRTFVIPYIKEDWANGVSDALHLFPDKIRGGREGVVFTRISVANEGAGDHHDTAGVGEQQEGGSSKHPEHPYDMANVLLVDRRKAGALRYLSKTSSSESGALAWDDKKHVLVAANDVGISCTDACENRNFVCNEVDLELANNCRTLMQVFPCEGGCGNSEAEKSEMPVYEM